MHNNPSERLQTSHKICDSRFSSEGIFLYLNPIHLIHTEDSVLCIDIE